MATQTRPTPKATHLLVSCIDHRCTDDAIKTAQWLIHEEDKRSARKPPGEPKDRFDHIVLPGASIGVMQRTFPSWSVAFFEQLWVALALHPEIETIYVMNHLHCGAYQQLYPWKVSRNQDRAAVEQKAHQLSTKHFADEIEARFPRLKVRRFLLKPTEDARVTKTDWCAVEFRGNAKVSLGHTFSPCRCPID